MSAYSKPAALDIHSTGVDAEDRLAHLVLKRDWPIALCGANVSDHLGTKAPAMDRCADCLRIARDQKLGRPGWEAKP